VFVSVKRDNWTVGSVIRGAKGIPVVGLSRDTTVAIPLDSSVDPIREGQGMVPLDHVLALAVLIAPPADGDPVCPREHACIWRTIKAVSLSLQLIDPREGRYVLARSSDFESDVPFLRRRQADLGGAPPLTDAWALPRRELACQLLTLNRKSHRHLIRQRDAIGDYPGLDELLAETERRYKIWDAVRDAGSEFYYVSVRRAALAQLRQMLGDEAYHLAKLPPAAVPGAAD
jgi:hypothetical protein